MTNKIIDKEITEETTVEKTLAEKHQQQIAELLGNASDIGIYVDERLKNIMRKYWTTVDIGIASIALYRDLLDEKTKGELFDAITWSRDNWKCDKEEEYVLGRLDHDVLTLFTAKKMSAFISHVGNIVEYMSADQLGFCIHLFKICHEWSKGEQFGVVTPNKYILYEAYSRVVDLIPKKIKNKFEARVRKCVEELSKHPHTEYTSRKIDP